MTYADTPDLSILVFCTDAFDRYLMARGGSEGISCHLSFIQVSTSLVIFTLIRGILLTNRCRKCSAVTNWKLSPVGASLWYAYYVVIHARQTKLPSSVEIIHLRIYSADHNSEVNIHNIHANLCIMIYHLLVTIIS